MEKELTERELEQGAQAGSYTEFLAAYFSGSSTEGLDAPDPRDADIWR